MKLVETPQDKADRQARAAREALEQAYAYYTPETMAAAAREPHQDQLFGYYQAA